MSDLQIQTETQQVPDLSWIRSFGGAKPLPATMSTTNLIEATHYPNGYVPSGTAVAIFTTGATEVGLWTPWVQDGGAVGFEGEEVMAGVVYTGFQVRKTKAGALVSTRTTGSILIPNQGAVLIPSKMPELLLTNDVTANPILAADLTTAGFIPLDLGV